VASSSSYIGGENARWPIKHARALTTVIWGYGKTQIMTEQRDSRIVTIKSMCLFLNERSTFLGTVIGVETRFRKITFTYSTKIKTMNREDFNSHLYALYLHDSAYLVFT